MFDKINLNRELVGVFKFPNNEDRFFPVLLLLPLFRLLNAAMPVFFSLTLYSYPLVYAPMFLPIYLIMKERMLSLQEAGMTFKDFWLFLPLAVAVGLALGWGEYNVCLLYTFPSPSDS